MYGVPNIMSYPAGDETAFDGMTDDDAPRYKIAMYEWSNGGWVPTDVIVVTDSEDDEDDDGEHPEGCRCDFCEEHGEHPEGCRCHKCSGFVPYGMAGMDDEDAAEDGGYEDDGEDEGYEGAGFQSIVVDDYDPVTSPMYGKAVVLAAARREGEARMAALSYRSIVPLDYGYDAHTAGLGRMLTPRELMQRRMAAKAAAEKRKAMRLSNHAMLEDRRRALRAAEREMKQKRRLARKAMRDQRKKGGYWRQLGKSAKHALGHEFETAGHLFTGQKQIVPLKHARRAALSVARYDEIVAMLGGV